MTSVRDERRLHDIYRMRDLSGRLLYIGVTNGGLRRFMEHAKDKTWWREVAQIDVEHVHCSRPVIESIEREAIRSERPLYNVVHNVDRGELPAPTPNFTTDGATFILDDVDLDDLTATPRPPMVPLNDAVWVGDIVRHPAFGIGRVTQALGIGEKRELTIKFNDKVGTKYLAAAWAPLEIIEASGAT